MVTMTQTYKGSGVLQRDMYPDEQAPNFLCTDKDGLIFSPSLTDGSKVVAEAISSFQPTETFDFFWNSVMVDLNRQASVPDNDFLLTLTLQGITGDGYVTDLAKKIINTCPTTLKKETLTFDLIKSACQSAFTNELGTAPVNKIQVNMPLPLSEYEYVTLNRQWLDGWSKRKLSIITGSTDSWIHTYTLIGPITVAYDSDMQTDFEDVRFVLWNGYQFEFLQYMLWKKTDGSTAQYFIKIPKLYQSPVKCYLYMFYGNGSATYIGNLANVFYEDWEDGAYGSGRTSPYAQWLTIGGTPSIVNQAGGAISGNYSLNHNGNGTTNKNQGMRVANTLSGYWYKFNVKIKTQGTNQYAPYWVIWLRYVDANNNLGIYTYWAGTYMDIVLIKTEGGTPTELKRVHWTTTRQAAGTGYTWSVIDWNGVINLYNAGNMVFSVSYSCNVANTHKGFAGFVDSGMMFDNILIHPYDSAINAPTIGAWSSEESNVTINPDTPADAGLLLNFDSSNWLPQNPAYLKVKPYNKLEYISRDIPLSNQSICNLGPDGLDAFNALRVLIEANCNSSYSFSIPRIQYKYEV